MLLLLLQHFYSSWTTLLEQSSSSVLPYLLSSFYLSLWCLFQWIMSLIWLSKSQLLLRLTLKSMSFTGFSLYAYCKRLFSSYTLGKIHFWILTGFNTILIAQNIKIKVILTIAMMRLLVLGLISYKLPLFSDGLELFLVSVLVIGI